MLTMTTPALLLALIGCSQKGVDGVYLLTLPPAPEGACDTEIDENYSDADPIEGGAPSSDWEITDSQTGTGGAVYVEVFVNEGSDAYSHSMVMGKQIYLGVGDGDSVTFSWESSAESTHTEEHDQGYVYEEEETQEGVSSFTFDFKAFTGEAAGTSTATQRWIESDEWDQNDVPIASSQMPAMLDGQPNGPNRNDCSGDECEITVTNTCDGSGPFTFTRVTAEDTYDGIDEASR